MSNLTSKNDIYLYKKPISKNAEYKMWMAFPGVASFARSSLGYLWMYKTIDEDPDIDIEMLCADTKTTKFMKEEIRLIGFLYL